MPSGLFPVSQLLMHPPLSVLHLEPLGFVCEGDGAIAGDPGPIPTRYGFWWEFTVVPPGLGHTVGGETTWTNRLAQLRVVHTLREQDLVTDLLDVQIHRVVYMLRELLPTRIEFWVLPGVTMNFHYVI